MPWARTAALITNRELDGAAHPAVVLLREAGRAAFRCSGTLIAPTLVLIAGYCTGEPGEFSGMCVFAESDVQNGTNSYPFAGANSVEARACHTHPQYTNAAFFLHDVGVMELAAPMRLAASAYGQLPAANQLDALKPSRRTVFTAVDYGLQRINPARSRRSGCGWWRRPTCCRSTPASPVASRSRCRTTRSPAAPAASPAWTGPTCWAP